MVKSAFQLIHHFFRDTTTQGHIEMSKAAGAVLKRLDGPVRQLITTRNVEHRQPLKSSTDLQNASIRDGPQQCEVQLLKAWKSDRNCREGDVGEFGAQAEVEAPQFGETHHRGYSNIGDAATGRQVQQLEVLQI